MSGGYGAIFEKIKSLASNGSKKVGRGNRPQHLDSTPNASSRTSRVDMAARDAQPAQRNSQPAQRNDNNRSNTRTTSRSQGKSMRRTDRG